MGNYNIAMILIIAFSNCLAQTQDVFHIKFNFKTENTAINTMSESTYLEVWTNSAYQSIILREDVEHHYLYNSQDSTSYIRLYNESKEYIRLVRNQDFETIKLDLSSDEQKTIAGYDCKLAKIKFENPGDGSSATCYIWYAVDIPKFYPPIFPYFKSLPGAVLSMQFDGDGMEAYEISQTTKPTPFFDIPVSYIDADMMEERLEIDNYLGDERYYYIDNTTELYGVMDADEKIITPALYTRISNYNFGIAIVTNPEGKYAAIDTNGTLIYPFKYDYLTYEPDGSQYIFEENSKYGLIKDNKIIIPAEYDNLHFFHLDYAICVKDNKYGLIDINNKIVVPTNYDNITDYRADVFIVEKNQKYSLYDIKNLKMIASGYQYISLPIQDELILVQKDDKFGYMDKKGKIVIPIQYSYASNFYDGIATLAFQEDLEDVHSIDTKGNRVDENQ